MHTPDGLDCPDFDLALPERGRAGSGIAAQLLRWVLGDLAFGRLDVVLPGGGRLQLAGRERTELHGQLRVRDPGALLRHVLRDGEVGFGEAYVDGCWDSPDLPALLAVLLLNEPGYRAYEKNWAARLHGWWQHRRRHNSKANASRNVRAHYDLGNAFYAQWLDPTMTYSSAVFACPGQSLEEAQRHKYALLAGRLQLEPRHHLLEIGSGWGGFAIWAAQQHGCRVTSVTLSPEQLREATRRAEAAGVSDRVRFLLRDYRDLDGSYDRIVSIEMYEAVGEAYWPAYFRTIAARLAPGGRAALQGITIDPAAFPAYRGKRDFIQKHIFPGGMLAPPARIAAEAAAAGLVAEAPSFHGADYARTLALWRRAVDEQRGAILRQFDARFLRLWRYYLAYCECGFATGRVDLEHVTLRHAGALGAPA